MPHLCRRRRRDRRDRRYPSVPSNLASNRATSSYREGETRRDRARGVFTHSVWHRQDEWFPLVVALRYALRRRDAKLAAG